MKINPQLIAWSAANKQAIPAVVQLRAVQESVVGCQLCQRDVNTLRFRLAIGRIELSTYDAIRDGMALHRTARPQSMTQFWGD